MIIPVFALLVAQQALVANQTRRAPRDTGSVVATDRTAAAKRDTTAAAQVALDFGGGVSAPFLATAIDLSVSAAPPIPKTPPSTVVQLKFLRAPDSLTPEIASRAGTNTRMPSAELTLPSRGATPGMSLRLYDVQVASMRLVTNDDNIALVQQRLGLQESIAQLGIDLQEAQRQLAVTESLDKRKLSSSLEVAHAHATADALASRLAVQQQHLAIVEQLLAHWTPVREEIVLTASRVEMQAR
jgi:hypothetical protein